MKSENDIERTLDQMGRDWPASASIADSVIRRLEGEKRPPAPAPPTRKRSVRVLLAAVAVLVAAGTWSYFWVQENSLAAQVIRAMDAAQSLDVVTRVRGVGPNGEDRGLAKAAEAWFVEGQGFRYDWVEEIRVGNEKYFWRFNPRTKTAVRSASGGIRKLLNDRFDVHKLAKELADFERDPAADTNLKNEHLMAYRLTRTAHYADRDLKEGRRRLIVFLDERSRIARVEHLQRQKGAWVAVIVDEWSYDVAIDPKLFEPNFGSGVRIIDADRAFDDLVDLKQAVHVENRSGLIYAVHRIERFEGGGLFVMSSVRGDEETLKRFPLQRRMIQPGLYHDDGPAVHYLGSSQGNGYFRIVLASANHQGIDVQWWMQVPRGQPENYFEIGSNQVWVDAGITPWGEYANTHRDQRGVINHLMWRSTLKVPKPPALPTLKAIAESAYADIAMLDALPPFDRNLDLGIDETTGQPVRKTGTTSDTTPAQFADAVERHVRWWFHQDIEFQFKMATDATSLAPDTVGLSFIPHLGDGEIARLGALTRLKRLYLRGTGVTDAGLASLSGLAQLETLDLSDTGISDKGLEHLAGLHALKELDLKNTHVTAQGVERLKTVNPRLKVRI